MRGHERDAALAARVAELLALQQQAAVAGGRGLAALLDASQSSSPASSRRGATVAFTSPNALAADVASTQRLLRETTVSDPDEQQQPEQSDEALDIPTPQELPELLGDLYQALDCGHQLSAIEQTYADALLQLVVTGLAHLVLAKPSSQATASQPMDQVRVWLLEMVVRPTALSRRLAFTLFYNISVTTTAILLVQSIERVKDWHTRLFQLLVEMLSKAVVVASSSGPASKPENAAELVWIDHALSSLLLFVKHKDRLRGDRLALLDPQILCFLLQETCGSASSNGESDRNGSSLKLAELLVFSMYSHQHQLQPKDEAHHTGFALSAAVVERFGGMEFLLAIFYSTASWRLQMLLIMAFFDRAVDQTRVQARTGEDYGELEALLRDLVGSGLPQLMASTPLLFTGNYFATMTKKMLSALPSPGSSLSHAQAQSIVSQLRSLMQVDEYFSKSTGLVNTIKFIASQEKTAVGHQSHTLPDTLMARVAQLLGSPLLETRFQGERWLAELLVYGTDDQQSLSLFHEQSSSSSEGDGGSIRIAARAKLWELAKSSAVGARQSFAQVVGLYLRRKKNAKSSHSQRLNLMQELDACATVLLQQQESSPIVLAHVLMSMLSLSKSDVSALDKQRLRYDRQHGDQMSASSSLRTDSLPLSILKGETAIDQALLQVIAPEFLLHALSVLCKSSHPPQTCRQRCCGISRSLAGDLAACIAMLLPQILTEPDQSVETVQSLFPYLDACDTRLAIFVAKFVREQIKHNDPNSYFDALREMHNAAVEYDDEALLGNVYLHTRQLLLLQTQ